MGALTNLALLLLIVVILASGAAVFMAGFTQEHLGANPTTWQRIKHGIWNFL